MVPWVQITLWNYLKKIYDKYPGKIGINDITDPSENRSSKFLFKVDFLQKPIFVEKNFCRINYSQEFLASLFRIFVEFAIFADNFS